MNKDWYLIKDIQEIDSPALVVYHEHLIKNIDLVKTFTASNDRLRPHVKTHKSENITKLFIEADIKKFKCATIAEAEMLATTGAKDVLLAYQPVGPKVNRLAELAIKFPKTLFACLIDNIECAQDISNVFTKHNIKINVYIDLNVGMNRTGISPDNAKYLFSSCQDLRGINFMGLHAYDGHLRDADLAIRTQRCNDAFSPVETLKNHIEKEIGKSIQVIAGGTPTFPIHAKRKGVECSPGTFIYWDKGYQSILSEQPFLFAALLITRIISKPSNDILCVDLGHKSVASENSLDKRVHFLNAPDLQAIGHSEEHMTLQAQKNNTFKVGDVLYGIPYHICPTVALHDEVILIKNQQATERWSTLARKRKITI